PCLPSLTLFPYTTLFRSEPSLHLLDTECRTHLLSSLTPSQTDRLNIHKHRLKHPLFGVQPYLDQQIIRLSDEYFYYVHLSYFLKDRKSTRLNSSHVSISY